MYKKLLAILMVIFSFASFAKDKLKIGVTLQPYYSFAVNIVKDKAEVVPVVRLDKYDSHSYQPKPEDIKRMNELDVLVVNKIDRRGANPEKAVDGVLELFIELGADDDQLDFPVFLQIILKT